MALLDRLDWIGLDWIGLDWIGLDWIGLDWIGLDWIVDNELTSCCVVCLLARCRTHQLALDTHDSDRENLVVSVGPFEPPLAVLYSAQCGYRYLTFALERASCQHSRLLHSCCRCSRHQGRHHVVDDQQPLGPDESVHPRGDEGECPRDRW